MDERVELELTDTARRAWRIQLTEARATFIPSEGASASVARGEVNTALRIFHTLTGKVALLVSAGDARAVFHLEQDAVMVLGRWMGRQVMMRMAVRAFATIAMICGALWIFGAFADAPPDLEPAPYSFDRLALGLGTLGMVAGAAGRWRPTRYVLVAYAAWCIGIGVHGMWEVAHGSGEVLWLMFSFALAAQAFGQIRMFFALSALEVDGR